MMAKACTLAKIAMNDTLTEKNDSMNGMKKVIKPAHNPVGPSQLILWI